MTSLTTSLRGFKYRPDVGRFRDYLGRVTLNAIHHYCTRPKQPAALLSLNAWNALDASGALNALSTEVEEREREKWEQEWMRHHYRLAMRDVRKSFEPKSIEMFGRLLAGSTVQEVARSFATTPDAVEKVKQRIRNRLREKIAAQIEDEEFDETA